MFSRPFWRLNVAPGICQAAIATNCCMDADWVCVQNKSTCGSMF